MDDVRHAEGRAERLYQFAEGILGRALEAKDLRTALSAIQAATRVLAEARAHIELRGDLADEMDKSKVYAPNGKIMVLAMPKCAGVSSRRPVALGLVDTDEN